MGASVALLAVGSPSQLSFVAPGAHSSFSSNQRPQPAAAPPRCARAESLIPGVAAGAAALAGGWRKARRNGRRVARRGLEEEYGLPPKLAATANALKSLPNDRLRYQQLMALAAGLKPMAPELKTPEHKVPGCLSTVHVHATLESDRTITFVGDSDAIISKGLVALLVNGLTGCTVEQIQAVKPDFIKASGITASLTPGRNNGFFNMFKLMNRLALDLKDQEPHQESESAALAQPLPGTAAAEPPLQIFNTLSRQKESFQPLERGHVRMYVCGVTVYDLCHLGHARVMVFFDAVQKYLRHRGFKVTFVRNVTDIDDKIIRRANESGEPAEALARRMELEMQKDAASLGCDPPSHEPRATESVTEIMEMVQTLEKKGFAYPAAPPVEEQGGEAENRDVYFRVRSFEPYGRLSRCSLDGNLAGARVEVGTTKEAPEDFVLWKAAKPKEPSWASPWGQGRPGWHIECSAMAKKLLGDTLDIHGGGPDLVFPHHENEIAQSEAANGRPFVKTWMHCAAVRSTGEEKMSKSLGNFVTIRDVLERFDGEVVRYYLLSSQYRQPLRYAEDALIQAQERLLKLYTALRDVPADSPSAGAAASPETSEAWAKFHTAMSNDFDTVNAMSALNDMARELLQLKQTEGEGTAAVAEKARQLKAMGGVLGLLQRDPEAVLRGGSSVDSEFEAKVEGLLAERVAARDSKNWARADEIREELNKLGVVLEDGGKGKKTTWRVGAAA